MMASRNVKISSVQGFDATNVNDKMQSSTLKRQPSPDWSKTDLLRLLSYFEGELQARDIAIATLKAEKAKQLLYQAKYGRFGLGDPFVALQRDAEGKNDTGFDEAAIKSMYDNQLAQLENLIATQRKAQLKMREQLGNSEKRFHKVCTELEEEKQKHAQDTAQGDDVTYMLEKERERLKAEIDFEKSQNKKLEKDLKRTLASLEEERANAARHKQVAIMLIKERKNLIERIVAENHLRDEMENALTDGKSKIQTMAEGLAQESKKSLKMEAALDKQSCKFDSEREALKIRLQEEEKQTNMLRAEVARLSKQLESLQIQVRNSSSSPGASQTRSSVSPARSSNPTASRGAAVLPVVGSASQSVSPSPNNNPPQGYSAQSSTSVSAVSGVRPGANIYTAHGMTSKLFTVQPGVKVTDGLRINSSSPEKEIYKSENAPPPGNLRRGAGPVGMRIGPAGTTGVDRLEVDVGSGARVINISPGSAATVTTHGGGKISFHVAGSGSPGSSQGPVRKAAAFSSTANTSPVVRGIPPPIPPNKPNFVSTVTSNPKPSPPPKVSVVGSGVLIQSPGQDPQDHFSHPPGKNLAQQPQRAVQIPVTVVGGVPSAIAGQPSPSGSIASVRTQVRETSPSAVRKTSQPLVVSTPLDHHSSTVASVVDALPDSSQLEFLAPEMANLQNMLTIMLTGETSSCNTHVTTSANVNTHTTYRSTNIPPNSAPCYVQTSSFDSSTLHSPNLKPNHYDERNSNAGDLHKDIETKALMSLIKDGSKNIPANSYDEQNIPNSDQLHFTNIKNCNIPHHVQNDYLEKSQANIKSPHVWSSSPVLTEGNKDSESLPAQSLLTNYKSVSSMSSTKSVPFSYSTSSTQLALPHGSTAPQTSFSNTTQCELQVHQLTGKGDVVALQQLLSSSPSFINTISIDCTTPLHRAAEHNQESCLKLLLDSGAMPNCCREDQMTPLHIASSKGYSRCVELLLVHGAKVNLLSNKKQTPLHLATKGGHFECCQILMKYEATVMLTDQDGLTCVHYAVQHNQPLILKSFLNKLGLLNSQHKDSELGYQLLAISDKDGWTITHMAAYLPKPDCLIILAESLNLDFEVKDKLGRSVRVVASPLCKEIFSELDHFLKPTMKVNVELRFILEKKIVSNVQIGALDIGPAMSWKYLEDQLSTRLSDYLARLDAGLKTRRISQLDGDSEKDFSLGVMVANITQYELGYYKWTPGMLTDTMPYVILSNNQHRKITVIVDDTGNMNELIAFDVLQPVSAINNYLRLLEQYKTVIFYGPAGSGKSYLAQRLAQSVAAQELAMGRKPAIYQLSLDSGYSWAKFYAFLTDKNCVVSTDKVVENIAPIVVLDNLEKVDLAHIFGGLLDAMEYRGMKYAFALKDGKQGENGMHYLADHFYIIGTMNKSRSLGVDLSILPRFRWVQFRLDTEPLQGLLARHFMRRMYNIYSGQLPSPDNLVLRTIEWIVCVWHRLNDSLNKLGLSEVVIGPCMFFKCPLEKQDHKLLLEWVKNFWNKKVAPSVREAVRRGTGSESASDGHNKVANTALYVLMQRSIMLSCPLTGQEKDNYLAGFSGSNELDIPLKSNISSSTSTQNYNNAGSRYMLSRKLRNETDQLNSVRTIPSTTREVISTEERASSESNLTSKIKRRSLSESRLNKAAQLEEQTQELDDILSPSSSQAKVAKLEVKSPKLVNIKSVFFTLLSNSSQKPESSSFNSNLSTVKTGRVSPLLSLVSNRNTSPLKSRSTENISFGRAYSFGKAKSPGPFSFSLTAPKSNLDFLKCLDEEKLSKKFAEEMPDFSLFEKLSCDEMPDDFFVKKDKVTSPVNSENNKLWNKKLDNFTVVSKEDNSVFGSTSS